jgi:pimeloyl-ACP methyl ester carboxylesterase
MNVPSCSGSFKSAIRSKALCNSARPAKVSAVVTTKEHGLQDAFGGGNASLRGRGTKAISVRRLLLALMALAICVNSVQAYAQTETPVGRPSTLPARTSARSNTARARVTIRAAEDSLSSYSDPMPEASGTTAQQVGPPILFAHGICDHPNSWDQIRLSLAAYLQTNHGSQYPNPNMYIAVANPATGNFSFYDGNGQVLGSPVPSNARFFSIAFLDPDHLDSLPLDFDAASTMSLPIWEKGDELAWVITAIKQITGVPKVFLVGHSMGGLDARSYLENLGSFASHKPGNDSDVVALTTIDTPHLGSPLAAISAIIPDVLSCGYDSSEDVEELVPNSSMMNSLNYNDGQAQDIPTTVSFDSMVNYVDGTDPSYLLTAYSLVDNVCFDTFQGTLNDGAVCRSSQNMSNAMTAYPFQPRPNIPPPNEYPFFGTCPTGAWPLHVLGCVGAQQSTQTQLKVDIINNFLQNSIDVEPQSVVLNAGKTQQFSVSLNGTAPSVHYVLLEDPTSLFINSSGLFTASDTGVFHVVATDTATGKQYGITTVTVNPAPQSSTLEVSFAGSGSGGVTSNPQGISCRANCSYAFPSNASVTLIAWPDTGMVVSGWSGCSTQTSSTCTVSMDSSKSVTVTFVTQQSNQLSPPTLNAVQISGSAISPLGTFSWSQVTHNAGYRILVATQKSALPIDPNSPSCSSSCLINLTVGANVTSYTSAANTLAPGTTYFWQVHALAGTGYSYGVWSNVGTFSTSQSPGQVQVTLQGSGTGTVTSSPSGINCPGVCSASFAANTAVTLSATASIGSQFLQWGGACAGASCTVSATGIQTVFANFNLNSNYTLTLGISGTGTVTSTDGKINCTYLSGTCIASYPSGTTVVLNGTPGTNYTLGGWSGACSGTGSCSVVMNQNQFAMAAFNVSSQPNGQLTVSTPSFAPVFNQGTAPGTIGLLVKNSSGGPMLGTAVASEQSGGAWMTVDGGTTDNWTAPETLSITFNPAGLSPGIYNGSITLASKQATNSQVVVPVTMTVLSPLLITTAPALPDAFSGKAYSTTLQASGGTGLTWSVDPNALPSGLTLNSSSGVISGTPGNINGNSPMTFVISVTDSSSRLAQQTFTMNWRQGVDVELLDNSLLQIGVGNPLYQSAGTSFIATGGTAPYTWSATGLPPGASLSSTGVFSGSPTTLGQFNIVLTATDSTGLSGSLTLTVTTSETLLQIYDSSQKTPPLLKPIVIGVPLTSSEYMEATGGTQAGYVWSIVGTLPLGVTAGPNSGCTSTTCALSFTGTPCGTQ